MVLLPMSVSVAPCGLLVTEVSDSKMIIIAKTSVRGFAADAKASDHVV